MSDPYSFIWSRIELLINYVLHISDQCTTIYITNNILCTKCMLLKSYIKLSIKFTHGLCKHKLTWDTLNDISLFREFICKSGVMTVRSFMVYSLVHYSHIPRDVPDDIIISLINTWLTIWKSQSWCHVCISLFIHSLFTRVMMACHDSSVMYIREHFSSIYRIFRQKPVSPCMHFLRYVSASFQRRCMLDKCQVSRRTRS